MGYVNGLSYVLIFSQGKLRTPITKLGRKATFYNENTFSNRCDYKKGGKLLRLLLSDQKL